jgi:hypothetical protein
MPKQSCIKITIIMAQQATIEIYLANATKAGASLNEIQQAANNVHKAIGNMKVGSDEYVEATKAYQTISGRLKNVRDEIRGASNAQKALVKTFGDLMPFGGKIGSLSSQFSNLKGSVGNVTKGFGCLRGAIIATGIGALVVLIGSLVSWLSKTQRGMDLMEKATASVGAILSELSDRAMMVIDAFKLLFSGKGTEAADMFAKSIKGVGDEMAREAKLAWELKDALQALERAEHDNLLTQLIKKKQIQELLYLVKDETKSFAERRTALQSANPLEEEMLDRYLELQKQRVANMLGIVDLTKLEEKLNTSVKTVYSWLMSVCQRVRRKNEPQRSRPSPSWRILKLTPWQSVVS